jgi:hypothetical protein
MSIKKSLLALAVAATAAMAFASPAMATDGVLRDVGGGTAPIAENTVLHLIGWTKFSTPNASFECHVTWSIKAVGTSGTTGSVTSYTIPDTTKCTKTGGWNTCAVKSHEAKNLPYHATITDNGRVDITGNIQIHSTYSGCVIKTTLLTIQEIQLTPLATGTRAVTGTEGKLGGTAALNEAIAGFEIDGFTGGGEVHMEDIFGGKSTEPFTSLTGEFELTSPERCTYEITAS